MKRITPVFVRFWFLCCQCTCRSILWWIPGHTKAGRHKSSRRSNREMLSKICDWAVHALTDIDAAKPTITARKEKCIFCAR
ncbi:hypothetical protein EV424DRAFT_1369501 [Suillus variegatus]|nr:hypothetical protein EV424DRAFT_1369501 [Suillus variegatus]